MPHSLEARHYLDSLSNHGFLVMRKLLQRKLHKATMAKVDKKASVMLRYAMKVSYFAKMAGAHESHVFQGLSCHFKHGHQTHQAENMRIYHILQHNDVSYHEMIRHDKIISNNIV